MTNSTLKRSSWLTSRHESARIEPNNARQGYVDLRIDTLKLAGYLFVRSA